MILNNQIFFEQVEAMLVEGEQVQIRMKGHSMRPLLRDGRDIAVLTPVARYANGAGAEALKPDDVVLFRHAKQHILHRIRRIDAAEEPRFTLAGDGNNGTVEQCPQSDIVAVMTCIIRPSGRQIRVDSRQWRWMSRCWLATPLLLRRISLSALWRIGVR